jgi:hypothetical protein
MNNTLIAVIDSLQTLRNGLDTSNPVYHDSAHYQKMNMALDNIKTLLTSINLDPDRKYSIADIDRLKIAVEWALNS